jgi:hypothetical protein
MTGVAVLGLAVCEHGRAIAWYRIATHEIVDDLEADWCDECADNWEHNKENT